MGAHPFNLSRRAEVALNTRLGSDPCRPAEATYVRGPTSDSLGHVEIHILMNDRSSFAAHRESATAGGPNTVASGYVQ
jgi:hypothetical protein